METDRQYEGWANYETWAIALEISNDEPMYRRAVDFMTGFGARPRPYAAFVRSMGLRSQKVWPDSSNKFTYGTRKADIGELDRFLRDLVQD